MKKIFYIFAILLLGVSCSDKVEDTRSIDGGRLIPWSFDAAFTKASIGISDGAFAWNAGDQISIWNQTAGSFVAFTTTIGSGKFSALAPADAHFAEAAFYPAGIATTTDALVLPAVYSGPEASATSFPMCAEVSEESTFLSFKHLGAILVVNLKNVPAGVSNIEISSSEKSISGAFTIASGEISATDGTSAVSVALSVARRQNMSIMLPIPVGTYPIIIKIGNEEEPGMFEIQSSSAMAFSRANLYSLEVIDLNTGVTVIDSGETEIFTLENDGDNWE